MTGTRISNIDPLALQIVEGVDPSILARDHGKQLGVNAEYGAQVIPRTLVRKGTHAVKGVVLLIGLGHAHVLIARPDGIEVGYRATGGGRRTLESCLAAVTIDQFADGLTDDVVNARLSASANSDKLVGGGRSARQNCQQQDRRAHC